MQYLTIGELNIPVSWLAFIAAVLFSDFRGRRADPYTNKTIDQLLYLYVIIWKSSYLLFSWTDFVKAPLSLLYFDGGGKGHALALFVMAIILYLRRNRIEWQVLWHYWIRFSAVYQVIVYSFEGQWLAVALWLTLLVLAERQYNYYLLFAGWLLLVWLGGFADGLTHVHAAVLLTLLLETKQIKHLATIGLVSLVAFMLADIPQAADTTARGEINLPTATGGHYRLAEQGQALTVVNFFATWCPPCKAEMPHLQRFAENLPSDVAIIGVNLTARDDGPQALEEFMDTYQVTYPILLDGSDEAGTTFHVRSIPTTVILNADGKEVDRIVGPISEDALRNIVEQHR
ncbi:MAG: TlpA family protein disulfide reductase [Bacillus sp. (in: firmicutes)]